MQPLKEERVLSETTEWWCHCLLQYWLDSLLMFKANTGTWVVLYDVSIIFVSMMLKQWVAIKKKTPKNKTIQYTNVYSHGSMGRLIFFYPELVSQFWKRDRVILILNRLERKTKAFKMMTSTSVVITRMAVFFKTLNLHYILVSAQNFHTHEKIQPITYELVIPPHARHRWLKEAHTQGITRGRQNWKWKFRKDHCSLRLF